MFERLENVFGSGMPEGDISIAQLQKALMATGQAAGLGSTGFRALVYEDLETVLKLITFSEAQFANTIWNRIKGSAVEAKSISHEFIKQTAYGQRSGLFSPEAGTAATQDAQFKRDYVQMCFMRQKRQWTHVSDFENAIQSPEQIQIRAATLDMSEKIERAIFSGDSSVVPEEFNGLDATLFKGMTDTDTNTQVPTDHIIDLAGAYLGSSTTCRDMLNAAALAMARGGSYGLPSDMFIPMEVQGVLDVSLTGGLERILDPRQQQTPAAFGFPGVGANGIVVGAPVSAYRSSYGNIAFRPEYFVGAIKTPPAVATGGTLSPIASATGGAATVTAAVATVTGAKLSLLGTYNYVVTSENAAGESLPATCAAATTLQTTENQIILSITPTAASLVDNQGQNNGTSGFRIYRTKNTGISGTAPDYELIDRIPNNGAAVVQLTRTKNGNQFSSTGGVTSFFDWNGTIAGTHSAYVLDLASEGQLKTMGWAQLAPFGRYPLPMLDSTYQFMMFLYGALMTYNPRKIVRIKNIGIGTTGAA